MFQPASSRPSSELQEELELDAPSLMPGDVDVVEAPLAVAVLDVAEVAVVAVEVAPGGEAVDRIVAWSKCRPRRRASGDTAGARS
jgi:hypothetical protein